MDGSGRSERGRTKLLVFADDWGRHPSSCQHLVKHLPAHVDVVWVDTIGSRLPSFDTYTLRRGAQKLRDWIRSSTQAMDGVSVVRPLMWPSFGSSRARRVNQYLLGRALAGPLAGHRWSAVSTTPLVVDLIDTDLPIDRWTYYCVDDLAQWPGLDSGTLAELESEFVESVDAIVASSQVLVDRMSRSGSAATLLTHGVDVDSWAGDRAQLAKVGSDPLQDIRPPIVTFWGVVDRRLDLELVEATAAVLDGGSIVFVGPENDPDRRLREIDGVSLVGPVSSDALPGIAASSAVLVIPYETGTATKAIQPLKLKEYLATGRPVVTTDLPSVDEWSDCCDVVPASQEEFAARVLERLDTDTPATQLMARERLRHEAWESKAEVFADVVFESGPDHGR